MRTKMSLIATAFFIVTLIVPSYVQAQSEKQKSNMPTEPIGGQPPAGAKSSVNDLDYQVKYQRAFEAVIWSMPAIGIYGFLRKRDQVCR